MTIGEPDWNDLRFFLAAARAGTLSGAARALGVRHTTIGRRLAALETALGASLVLRGPQGVEVTPLGRRLLPLGEDLERAIEAITALARPGTRRVRLALPTGFSPIFAERMAAFRKACPGIGLELTSGSRPVDLRHGEADLAVRIGTLTDETLVARKLCVSGWSLYASRAYLDRHPMPIDPRSLSGHEIIGFHENLAGVPGARWIEAHGEGATIVLRVAEMTEMLAAALGGAGLAVMPCMLAEPEPRMVRLTPDILGSHPVSLVCRREIGNEAPVRAVIRFVTAVIKDHAALIGGEPRRLAESGSRTAPIDLAK
ncbi:MULTISPECIES: LysR family transcriptional regulator [unclassified Mesorhizobium]|uniref:LysR family transcriptional regulator n=1 Tax=unclassified Mesorhizobium TaxID=325217 RepID=UPI000F764B05|nr:MULTISPECIES: LysR family transcriptional regulator [unclassified Mesorhizobium]AZO70781.1 LysR family transcriptional regulator [Mesorhizobium sp. M1D.F.Ca.ET.043.01.1.1]RWA89345.1 MAG: LysR family transcriptional regulator [Mesorhizobium sp.]RWE15540.1 MAG: LysR family transcriptional regulator [Mesorhizobium sp.]